MKEEIEKLRDSIANVNSTLEEISENGKDEKEELRVENNYIRQILDVMGLEIAPELRVLQQKSKDLYELYVAQNANDTIMKMLEVKKMHLAGQISEVDFVCAVDAFAENFSLSIYGKDMTSYSASVKACIPNIIEYKQEKKLKELDKNK